MLPPRATHVQHEADQLLGYAVIRPKGRRKNLDVELWRALVRTTEFLRPAPPLRELNPFTEEPILLPIIDSADVVLEGESFGRFVWDNGCLHLDGPESILTPLGGRIAEALGGRVFDADGQILTFPAGRTLERAIVTARCEREADFPRGKSLPLIRYPGSYDIDFLSSEKRWAEVARECGLPSRDQARISRSEWTCCSLSHGSGTPVFRG